MHFGAIADDITGATDLGSLLRRGGLSVAQTIGVPESSPPDVDAVIVSLKIRTAPVDIARNSARAAAGFLSEYGASHLYFKYRSTFDSTPAGNIGPIIETLIEGRSAFTVACPAYPALRRTTYVGHLFVDDRLLSESSMRDHPLTPMVDSNLVRFLGRQTRLRVGLAGLESVDHGSHSLREEFALLRQNFQIAIVDAVFDHHIQTIAEASCDLPVTTGGAALGARIASLVGSRSSQRDARRRRPASSGPVAILSGSCSAATRAQIQRAEPEMPSLAIHAAALAGNADEERLIVEWAIDHARQSSFLIYSTDTPEAVRAAQEQLGRADAAALIEHAFRQIARALASNGVRTFVVAGGETSGAVLEALEIDVLEFGDEIDPGVPWVFSRGPDSFALALKSGNFGSADFFLKALQDCA
jgi:uncharacterized protein YgbK (DUF1537 family)